MAYLNPDGDYVSPSRVEATDFEPRFWINGKPECGVFTLGELQSAYPDLDELRSAIWSGRIVIDATRTCKKCGR